MVEGFQFLHEGVVAVGGVLELGDESLPGGGELLKLCRLLCVLSVELGLLLFYFLEVPLGAVYQCVEHHRNAALSEGGDL